MNPKGQQSSATSKITKALRNAANKFNKDKKDRWEPSVDPIAEARGDESPKHLPNDEQLNEILGGAFASEEEESYEKVMQNPLIAALLQEVAQAENKNANAEEANLSPSKSKVKLTGGGA